MFIEKIVECKCALEYIGYAVKDVASGISFKEILTDDEYKQISNKIDYSDKYFLVNNDGIVYTINHDKFDYEFLIDLGFDAKKHMGMENFVRDKIDYLNKILKLKAFV